MKNDFRKRERVTSQKLIDLLFGGGQSKSFVAFPLRAVWLVSARSDESPIQVLVSVPKKRLHHAVDRNRSKRQVREAYRLNKQLLPDALPSGSRLLIAFVWQSNRLEPSALVASRLRKLLFRIKDGLTATPLPPSSATPQPPSSTQAERS